MAPGQRLPITRMTRDQVEKMHAACNTLVEPRRQETTRGVPRDLDLPFLAISPDMTRADATVLAQPALVDKRENELKIGDAGDGAWRTGRQTFFPGEPLRQWQGHLLTRHSRRI